MQAYLDGKTIESSQGYGWKEARTPTFNFNAVQYRIKNNAMETSDEIN